jgi:imidazoleglycerol phosphate dehydratase HisB
MISMDAHLYPQQHVLMFHPLEYTLFHNERNAFYGDIDVDDHHVTEDIGIVIGQLLLEMIKDKKHFVRYGTDYDCSKKFFY